MNEVSKLREFKAVWVYGSIVKGIIRALIALVLAVLIPKFLADMFTQPETLRSFVAAFGYDVDVSAVEDFLEKCDTEGLAALFKRAWMTGIVTVPLAFFKGFYKSGNIGRMIFCILVSVYSAVRYVIVMNFGDLSDLMTVVLTFNGQDVALNIGMMFTGALIIAVILRLLKIPKEVGSYYDDREAFIESKRGEERMKIFFE
jgi:hypothetical protein